MRVAFVGPIGSGKSATASALREAVSSYIDGATVLSFGMEVKKEAANAIGRDGNERRKIFLEMLHPELKHKWREIIQVWGTEVRRRNFGEDYWVTKISDIIKESTESIIIDDCRFWNEYNMLKEHNFSFVRCLPKEGNSDLSALHESERYWSTFPVDVTVEWRPVDERVDKILKRLNDL